MQVGCTTACTGGNKARQEGQYRLNYRLFLISSNWSRWIKAKDKVENRELKVYFQAVEKNKEKCQLGFL